VFADGGRADRKAQLAKVVVDIGQHIQHIDIAIVERRGDANVHVKLVRDRDLYRTIAADYGKERARDSKRSLDPECLAGFRTTAHGCARSIICRSDPKPGGRRRLLASGATRAAISGIGSPKSERDRLEANPAAGDARIGQSSPPASQNRRGRGSPADNEEI